MKQTLPIGWKYIKRKSLGVNQNHLKKIKEKAQREDYSDLFLGVCWGIALSFVFWLITHFF